MDEGLQAVVVGASSGVGRAVAEQLAESGSTLVLASRDPQDLDPLTRHIRLTRGSDAWSLPFDLCSPAEAAWELAERCRDLMRRVDVFILTAAQVSDADVGLTPAKVTNQLIEVNLKGAIHLLHAFGRLFERQGSGTLVVFSSVAAPVPRSNNAVYSATKNGLEAYSRALRHHLGPAGVLVQIYRLGYVDTSMAEGRTRLFPKISPKKVARHVTRRLGKDVGVAYYPRFWRFVVWALQVTPWVVYRRLRF